MTVWGPAIVAALITAAVTFFASSRQVRVTLESQERTQRIERRREAYVTLGYAVATISASATSLAEFPLAILIPSYTQLWLRHSMARLHAAFEEGYRALIVLELVPEPEIERLRELFTDYVTHAGQLTNSWRPKAREAGQQAMLETGIKINHIVRKAIADLDNERQHPSRPWWRFRQ